MKYGPFPMCHMLTTLGHMFPHIELTLRTFMVSLDEYLAHSTPITFTPLYVVYISYPLVSVFHYVFTDFISRALESNSEFLGG